MGGGGGAKWSIYNLSGDKVTVHHLGWTRGMLNREYWGGRGGGDKTSARGTDVSPHP